MRSLFGMAAVIAAAFSAANAQSASRSSRDITRAVSGGIDHGVGYRWYPWLGCWQADSAGAGGLQCIVPVGSSSAVEALTLYDGKVVARDRIDVSGRPHSIREQGCDGTESVHWSADGRRVFLRADYLCATGIEGTSTRLFSIASDGEWIEVEHVEAGEGSIAHVVRRRPVPIPTTLASLAPEGVAVIATQQLAITTARASSAAPITARDVIETVRVADAPIARAWLNAIGQHFDLDSAQVAALVQADVPASVVRAMLAASVDESMSGVTRRSVASDEYLSAPGYSPAMQQSTVVYEGTPLTGQRGCVPPVCYSENPYSAYNDYGVYTGLPPIGYPYSGYVAYPMFGFYGAPVIIRRGHGRGSRPIGVRPFTSLPPASRPPTVRPPIVRGPFGHAPVSHPAAVSGRRGAPSGRRP